MRLREAAQQALEALMWHDETVRTRGDDEAIDALRAALEQPEQEPVAWLSIDCIGERYLCFSKPLDNDPVRPLYTHPPRREWHSLSEEEINEATFHPDGCMNTHLEFARAIEAALKERNV